MTDLETLKRAVGPLDRYEPFSNRIEILLERQVRVWTPGTVGWLVTPVDREPRGFYLLAPDREGLRRGIEIMEAFLGPAVAAVDRVEPGPPDGAADLQLHALGLRQMARLVRVPKAPPENMLERLEDAVATVTEHDVRLRTIQPSHVDLLRDFRLALQNGDAANAENTLANLQRTGRLSAENVRFLTVELLGRLRRWEELADLPYLQEMIIARRPREVNEILMEMAWHTDAAERFATGRPLSEIFEEANLGSRYGTLLNSIDVPATPAGRKLALVASGVNGDSSRIERLLAAAESEAEADQLQVLVARAAIPVPALPDVRDLYQQGRYGEAARAFLEAPVPIDADAAVQAVIEGDDATHASAVLATVRAFIDENLLVPGRRLQRDLPELEALADGSCHNWPAWCARVSNDAHWPEAAHVLRSHHAQWPALRTLLPAEAATASDHLLTAWAGNNQDEITAVLDILCSCAADAPAPFADAVLLLLTEQRGLTGPVRSAYLTLLDRVLDQAPEAIRYSEILDHAADLWRRIASPIAVDWGLTLVDILIRTPVAVPDQRNSVTAEVLGKIHEFAQRLSPRQLAELGALAEESGLPLYQQAEPSQDENTVWRRLDGKTIGVYTLMSGAAASLARRLSGLCTPKTVEGNADTVDTPALRALATRADILIVDTWHATHAATEGIDKVKPRDRQIMPVGRGVTGFLRALEQYLTSQG